MTYFGSNIQKLLFSNCERNIYDSCSILKSAFLNASTENNTFYLEGDSDRRKYVPLKAIPIKRFYILTFWSLLPPKNTVWLAKSFFFYLRFIKDFLQNQYRSLTYPFSQVLSLL